MGIEGIMRELQIMFACMLVGTVIGGCFGEAYAGMILALVPRAVYLTWKLTSRSQERSTR